MKSRHPSRAFTLVELLAVVAILGVLMTLALPTLSSLLDSSNLARGGQVIADQINLARQIASARNTAVEVRLFKLPSQDTEGYGAVQLWSGDATGNPRPASRLATLPEGIVVSPVTAVSQAFAKMPSSTMPAGTGALADASYRFFQVRPSGVVTPVMDMADSYLTVVLARSATNSALPKNYVTIQINPLTATPLVYQP